MTAERQSCPTQSVACVRQSDKRSTIPKRSMLFTTYALTDAPWCGANRIFKVEPSFSFPMPIPLTSFMCLLSQALSFPSGKSADSSLSMIAVFLLDRCEVDGCSSYSRQLSQALSMPFDMDDDADSSDSAEITSKGFSTNRSGSAISSTSKGVGAEARAEYSQSAAHFNESAIQEGTRRSSGSSSGEQEDRFDSGIFRASGSEGIQDEAYESPPIWMAGALSRLASPASKCWSSIPLSVPLSTSCLQKCGDTAYVVMRGQRSCSATSSCWASAAAAAAAAAADMQALRGLGAGLNPARSRLHRSPQLHD
eukprot:1161511-Pelagomonas_calceolata.AAC.2